MILEGNGYLYLSSWYLDLPATEEKIKVLTLNIANEYELYVGKDLMTLDHLKTLIINFAP